MVILAGAIEEGELEEGADVGTLAGEGYEKGDVGRSVLGVLAVGVEVDRPVMAADGEHVGGDVLSDPDALRQREAVDGELVGAVDRSRDRDRCRRFQILPRVHHPKSRKEK